MFFDLCDSDSSSSRTTRHQLITNLSYQRCRPELRVEGVDLWVRRCRVGRPRGEETFWHTHTDHRHHRHHRHRHRHCHRHSALRITARAQLILRWPRNGAQVAFSLLPLFNALFENLAINHTLPETSFFGLVFCRRKCRSGFNDFDAVGRRRSYRCR